MKTVKVQYQIATYSGIELVDCDENDDNEQIIRRAKHQLRRKVVGGFPLGYQSFKIIPN